MASPFAVFRKNQQTLLVLLFILAMFAFIILGNLSTQRLSLPLLGMLVGMIVLTAVGVGVKKPMQYAAAGAIGGWLAGYIAVWSGLDTPDESIVIESEVLGDLDQMAVKQMMEKRHVANNFLSLAVVKARGEESQFAAQQYFFGFNGSAEQQAALSMILENEADKIGIAIGTDAVTAYIRAATDNKLSKEDFKAVLSELKLSENTLYKILADEIKVKTAWELLAPLSSSSTPVGLWENFKKMEVTQSLQVVAVPVDEFGQSMAKFWENEKPVPQDAFGKSIPETPIPEPSEEELLAFFEQRKNAFPGTPEPENFGFLQPRKIQLAYIEASYLDVESMVGDVSDEEVEEFYEENKEILFLNRRVPDFSRGQLINPSNQENIPELKLFDPADSKSSPEETKDSKVPPEPEGTTPGQPGLEAPKPEEQKPDPTESPKKDAEQESSQFSTTEPLQKVAFLNQEENQKEEAVKQGDQPEKAPAEPKQEDTPESKAEPDKKPTVPPAPEEPSKNVPPAPEEPAAEQPLVAEKPQPKYQPLDDALKASIRDQLLRDKTRAKQKELIDLVLNGEEGNKEDRFEGMINLSNEYFDIGTREYKGELSKAQADAERLKFIKAKHKQLNDKGKQLLDKDGKPVLGELEKLAAKYGLHYDETPLLDYQELTQSGDHPIGSAIIGDDPAASSALNVADKMFRGSPESVYEADRATSLDLNSVFAFWKTADVAAHVPKFEDEGIRDQVLEAWTEQKARELAAKRAESLKDELAKADTPWSEVLTEETVTGEKEGVILSTRTTSRFSWMRKQSVPSQFGFNMDRAELSTIPGIENIDDSFMNQVFNEMSEFDETEVVKAIEEKKTDKVNRYIRAIPNLDKSVYYVVKVLNRQPDDQAGWEAKREQFLKSDLFMFFSPYAQLTGNEQNEVMADWMKSLLKSYDVTIKTSALP